MKPILKIYDTHSILRFKFDSTLKSKLFVSVIEMFGYKIKHRSNGTVGKTVELFVDL